MWILVDLARWRPSPFELFKRVQIASSTVAKTLNIAYFRLIGWGPPGV